MDETIIPISSVLFLADSLIFAADVVISTVLQGGKDYYTDKIAINGENYYAYYKPVKNDGGQIVGMVFAGPIITFVKHIPF